MKIDGGRCINNKTHSSQKEKAKLGTFVIHSQSNLVGPSNRSTSKSGEIVGGLHMLSVVSRSYMPCYLQRIRPQTRCCLSTRAMVCHHELLAQRAVSQDMDRMPSCEGSSISPVDLIDDDCWGACEFVKSRSGQPLTTLTSFSVLLFTIRDCSFAWFPWLLQPKIRHS